MILLGAIVNGGAIFIGALTGLIMQKKISKKLSDFLMQGLGICVLYVGISGALKGKNIAIEIMAMVVGGMIGHWIDIDKRLNRFGSGLQKKLVKQKEEKETGFAEGFVNSTLFVCVGAMAVIGSLQSGALGNHEVLYAKSLIDMVVIVVMAATMGIGVLFSSISVFCYEAILTLSSSALSGFLTETMIAEMTCVGSLLIIAIGLNMLKLTNIKIANFLPAAFLPILFCLFL